jgi:RHS repeat-associated protein
VPRKGKGARTVFFPSIVSQVQQVYNGLGQLITEYQAVAGPVFTSSTPSVQYAYSFVTTSGGPNHSRLVSMTYPNGRVLNYNYNSGVDDRISRLSSISDSSATLEAYSYLGLNTVVTRSHPQSGINQTYVIPGGNPDGGDQYTGLDRFGRVVEEKWLNPNTNTVTDDFLYTYDRDGNRLTSSNALDSALSQQFSYDNLNQLATFTQGSHTESWSLDAVGNWLSFTDNGSTQTRSFNNQNQLTSLSGATTPTYDANGNTLTDDNGTRYSYDAWNRIVQVVAGSQIENFSYDALGRRDTIQNNSNFALDEYFSSNWQVVEEDQQGAVQNQFVWSSVYVDALVEQDSGSSRWYAQQDANWNVTAMLTSNGTVANRFVYDPYGKGSQYDASWNLQGGIGNGTWFYFFQGGRFDAGTGLYNFRNRDYAPTLGRWMEQDPVGYKTGDNDLYRYEKDEPVDSRDPTGLDLVYTPNAIPVDVTGDPGFKVCQRNIDAQNSYEGCANKCGGQHSYVQYGGVDEKGHPKPGTEGVGFYSGGVVEERAFRPNYCSTCERTNATLKYGSGAGKEASSASDSEIWDCIKNYPPRKGYNWIWYNCKAWAWEAVSACGLRCFTKYTDRIIAFPPQK